MHIFFCFVGFDERVYSNRAHFYNLCFEPVEGSSSDAVQWARKAAHEVCNPALVQFKFQHAHAAAYGPRFVYVAT
jgi:hypothetical protein